MKRFAGPHYCATVGQGKAVLTVAASLTETGVRLSIFDPRGRRTAADLTLDQTTALVLAFDAMTAALVQRGVVS